MTIRKIEKSDLNKARGFQKLINGLVAEEAKILWKEKLSVKTEKDWLEKLLKETKRKSKVYLFAYDGNMIVGSVAIGLQTQRRDHIGEMDILIANGYRGMGLGKYLMLEIMKLAKKELRPSPKIFQLEVYENNKPAIALYKKMGFKIVGKIPKQIQYKGRLIGEYIMIKNI